MSLAVDQPWEPSLIVSSGKRPSRIRSVLRWWPIAVLLVAGFAAAFPYLIAPLNPDTTHLGARLQAPGFRAEGLKFLLGTDNLGRDIFSRVIWGARVSVVVATTSVLVAGVFGGAMGILAGNQGRALGSVIMRIADMVLSIPFFLLAILVVAALGPNIRNLVIVLALVRWPRYARVAQAQTLDASKREFVKAAIALGSRKFRVVRRHILPEVLPSLVVVATLEVGLMVIYESALSFIGLGVQPPTPSWGSMLSTGQEYVSSAWWISTFPGIALFLLVVAVNRLGDLVRDLLDPRGHN